MYQFILWSAAILLVIGIAFEVAYVDTCGVQMACGF